MQQKNFVKISIVIPCFNEFNTLEKIIDKVILFTKYEKEIIIIDDCSNDGTREIINEKIKNKVNKIVLNERNFGQGYSIRKGIEEASGEIILIQDADLEYDPKDYDKLLYPIINGIADVVYGSRFKSSEISRVLYFWHTLGNKFLTLISNIFTNLNLTDMENCYKVFKKDIIKNIELKENRFGFEPEFTAKISKIKDVRIYEVSTRYFGRKYSEGKKIGWKDGISAMRCIIQYNLFK